MEMNAEVPQAELVLAVILMLFSLKVKNKASPRQQNGKCVHIRKTFRPTPNNINVIMLIWFKWNVFATQPTLLALSLTRAVVFKRTNFTSF